MIERVTSERTATRVFAVAAVAAWLLLLLHWGRGRWFSRDDWILLTSRDGGSFWSVVAPYGEHFIAVPTLIYRVLYNLVGVRFGAYLMVVVSMHLAVCVLLRTIMRRAGVGAWTATFVAGAFLLFGSGEENILWAFQAGFVGSLMFGLLQFTLADHRGPIGRRDVVGALAGVLAVASPGIGLVLVAATAFVTWIRRGERAALVQLVPPAVVYLTWYVVASPTTDNFFGKPTLPTTLAWAWRGVLEPARALSGNRWVTIALGTMALVGLALAAWTARGRARLAALAGPVVLAACAPAFFALVAQGRWGWGMAMSRSGRYLYNGAAVLLPLGGVAICSITRRWRGAWPVAIALVMFGVPYNVGRFDSSPIFNSTFYLKQRDTILGIASSPLLDEALPWVRPEPDRFKGTGLTVAWLRHAVASGKLPLLSSVPTNVSDGFKVRLGLVQHLPAPPSPLVDCPQRTTPFDVVLHRGDRVRFSSPLYVVELREGQPVGEPVTFLPDDGDGVLSVEWPSLDVRIGGPWNREPYTACLMPRSAPTSEHTSG